MSLGNLQITWGDVHRLLQPIYLGDNHIDGMMLLLQEVRTPIRNANHRLRATFGALATMYCSYVDKYTCALNLLKPFLICLYTCVSLG